MDLRVFTSVSLVMLFTVATLTEGQTAEDTDVPEEDEDFPDDGEAASDFRGSNFPTEVVTPVQRPSPVSIYVIRLLEILLGVENIYRNSSSRVTRAARQNMFIEGAFAPTDSPSSSSSSTSVSSGGGDGRNTGASYSNYYDFLINEGSYKFWAFFQLSTSALLVYSAFAALYYARYTYYTSVDYSDYDDYFFRRSGRTARSVKTTPPPPPSESPYAGLNPVTYRTIMEAVNGVHSSRNKTA